jgi:hypothetical protein
MAQGDWIILEDGGQLSEYQYIHLTFYLLYCLIKLESFLLQRYTT